MIWVDSNRWVDPNNPYRHPVAVVAWTKDWDVVRPWVEQQYPDTPVRLIFPVAPVYGDRLLDVVVHDSLVLDEAWNNDDFKERFDRWMNEAARCRIVP